MEDPVRLAGERDIPALCGIWRECFRDPEDYIRLFYRENFDRISVPVCDNGGGPVSMLHLLDADFRGGGETLPVKLIYAACTLPAYRQAGYMGTLLRYVTGLAEREGFGLFLKPASPEAAAYYKEFGFVTDARLRIVSLSPGAEVIPLTVSPIPPEEYNRMRDEAFSGVPYAKWPDRHLRWCAADCGYYGGGTYAVRTGPEVRFLMCSPEEGALVVTETDMSLRQLRRASGALCAAFRTDRIKAYLPENSCREGRLTVSSLVFNAPRRDTYVNLILI